MTEKKEIIFIDSSVAIELGFVKYCLECQHVEDDVIIKNLQNRNPTNIDKNMAENILKLYRMYADGEILFCISPTVYRETILDKKSHNAKYQSTLNFVNENCILAMPQSYTIFKEIDSSQKKLSKNPGLDPEFKKDADINLEDRLIISEIKSILKHKLDETKFIQLPSKKELYHYYFCGTDTTNGKIDDMIELLELLEKEGKKIPDDLLNDFNLSLNDLFIEMEQHGLILDSSKISENANGYFVHLNACDFKLKDDKVNLRNCQGNFHSKVLNINTPNQFVEGLEKNVEIEKE